MATKTFQQGVSSYSGCIDMHMRQGGANNNTGANNEFAFSAYTGGTPSTDQTTGAIKFDLTGQFLGTETVTSATLSLYIAESRNGSNNKTISIAAFRRAWIEGTGTGIDGVTANTLEPTWTYYSYNTLSWTAGGALDTTNDVYADYSSTALTSASILTTVTFNVQGIVQNFINSTYVNNGFFLHCTAGDNNNGQYCAASAQNATVANRPLLTVNYTTGAATTTGTTYYMMGV